MFKIVVLLSLAGLIAGQAQLYQQCGGKDWKGTKSCVSGATCQFVNEWYSQCVAGAAGATTKASAATTKAGAATTKAGAATTKAGAATTKAGAATTKAGAAASSGRCAWLGKDFFWSRNWDNENTDYSGFSGVSIWIDTIAQGCQYDPKCTDFNPYYTGIMAQKVKALNKIPIFYGYVIAFEARNAKNIQDCDVAGGNNLCLKGSQFIKDNRDRIIERYNHHSSELAKIFGNDYKCVWKIEPDFWQYYGDEHQEGGKLDGKYMRALFDDIATTIKKNFPNACISWDISAWIGESGMRTWWDFFKNSPHIDFIHTSGGQSNGGTDQIKPNELSWSFMSNLTGKKILADCGYGVAGGASNNREPWFDNKNVDARIRDGVIGSSLANADKNPSYKPQCQKS